MPLNPRLPAPMAWTDATHPRLPMLDSMTEGALLEALEDYVEEVESPFSPNPFVDWLIANRPFVLTHMGRPELTRASWELIPAVMNRAAEGW
jgi:hypothetical protein